MFTVDVHVIKNGENDRCKGCRAIYNDNFSNLFAYSWITGYQKNNKNTDKHVLAPLM